MRKQQQERIGLRGIVADILDPREKMELDTLDYYTEPIFPHEQLAIEPMAYLSDQDISNILRRVISKLKLSQSIALDDFSPDEEKQVLDKIRVHPDINASQIMELNLYNLCQKIKASSDPKRISIALLEQFNSQLGTTFDDLYYLDQYLIKNRHIIILDGVRDCIENDIVLENDVSAKLRSMGSSKVTFISRGRIGSVKYGDLAGSPFFNIFAIISRPVTARD